MCNKNIINRAICGDDAEGDDRKMSGRCAVHNGPDMESDLIMKI